MKVVLAGDADATGWGRWRAELAAAMPEAEWFTRDELAAAGIEVMDGDPLGWDWRLGA